VIASRHVILVSLGTDGDIIPYLAVGVRLRDRGHRISLLGPEHFKSAAAKLGFDFHPFVTEEAYQDFLADKGMWHPVKAGGNIAKWGGKLLRGQYALLKSVLCEDSVMVANPGALVARLAHEQFGIPIASLVLQPWLIQSSSAPPLMMPGLSLPRWAPPFVKKMYWGVINKFGDRLAGRELNRLRKEVGLGPMKNLFQWWFSPDLVIAMFPEWYGKAQPDWPRAVVNAGFYAMDGTTPLPSATVEFCHAGVKPVLFTFGTGMTHAKEHFGRALEVCSKLGKRVIFLTKYREQLPDPLPQFAHHCSSAPFSELFPLCELVVHHGGIGTTAKALKAGVPQLLLPFAYDQFDNGSRVAELGAGGWLSQRHIRTARFEVAIRACTEERIIANCARIRDKHFPEDGASRAVDLIEEQWARRSEKQKSAPKRTLA